MLCLKDRRKFGSDGGSAESGDNYGGKDEGDRGRDAASAHSEANSGSGSDSSSNKDEKDSGFFGGISDFFGGIAEAIAGAVEGIASAIGDVVGGIASAIGNTVSSIADALEGLFNEIVDPVDAEFSKQNILVAEAITLGAKVDKKATPVDVEEVTASKKESILSGIAVIEAALAANKNNVNSIKGTVQTELFGTKLEGYMTGSTKGQPGVGAQVQRDGLTASGQKTETETKGGLSFKDGDTTYSVDHTRSDKSNVTTGGFKTEVTPGFSIGPSLSYTDGKNGTKDGIYGGLSIGLVYPVLLDLGSGISLTENSGAAYSWGATGSRYATGWASATTGILAYDANNDGTISGRGELALADYVEGAQTDLEGLKHFDSNGDGSFDTKDAAWTSFKVWVDANQNGVSDAGELRSLDAADVAAIELKEQRNDKILGTNVHQGTGRYTTKDGTTRTAASVALGVDWAKVIEDATGIDLTSGRVPKTTALNTSSWKITLNDQGPMTPAMALAAFAAAGSAAAGQPATMVYEGSTFTRDAKGAITVAASVLASHGVFGAKNETSTHNVTAGDIVSDAIDPARIAASNIVLPGVTLDVQNALDRVAASTAGRSTVLFDGGLVPSGAAVARGRGAERSCLAA